MLGRMVKLQFKMISEQAKDYLAYMHQLYEDGIIPKDFGFTGYYSRKMNYILEEKRVWWLMTLHGRCRSCSSHLKS